MTVIRIIDLETTGLEPPEAKVCEVGITDLHLEEKRITGPRSWLCMVDSMPPEARAVHHISAAECSDQPVFAPEMLEDGTEIAAFAAHNADFEMKFIPPPKFMICTWKAALRIWPDAPAHNNGTLRYWLEDQGKLRVDHDITQPAHRAGPDTYVTAHILLALFDAGSTGRQMIGWTREPALLPKCPIGKFRGQPWSEVEGGFLSWMLRQQDMEPELKWNAQRELDRRNGGIA